MTSHKQKGQNQISELAAEDRDDVETDENRKPTEIISLDIDETGEEPLELGAETVLDLMQDAQEEHYTERIARHTDDETIQESLAERQDLKPRQPKLPERRPKSNTFSTSGSPK